MSASNDEKLAVAARFSASSRSGRGDEYRAMCAPGAVTWHNFDGVEVATEQTVRTLEWLHRTVPDVAWQDLAVLPTPTGFVSQTLMTGTAPGGPLHVHSCVVVTLDDDGLVTRIEEYLDSAQMAVLRS